MLGRKTREEVEEEMRPDRYLERYRSSGRSSSSPSSSSRVRTRVAGASSGSESDLRPCMPTRFQVLTVDNEMGIKEFCDSMGVRFQKGRGFYEFIKVEVIQPSKEIVLMDKENGNLYEGDVARTIAGISEEKARLKPSALEKYRVFIQSTSANRKLLAGQKFLYEVEETS
jgi:hypothetical protein